MNVLDIIILAILFMSVVYGLYHGFVQTVFSLGGSLLSLGAAFMFGPRLAQEIGAVPAVKDTLATYTDAIARVGDFDLANTRVSGLSGNVVDTVIKSVSLPEPIADILRGNLTGESFSGTNLVTINDYVSGTIVSVALQVISFLIVFAIAYAVVLLLLSVLRHIVQFPILKQLDWLFGGLLGLARGALIVYLLLLLMPLVETVFPAAGLSQVMGESQLAETFTSIPLFLRVVGA